MKKRVVLLVGGVFLLAGPAISRSAGAQVLHEFPATPEDGNFPLGGLVMDSAGALYGTTYSGGSSFGSGVVFSLSAPASGKGPWQEAILHAFSGYPTDGGGPDGDLLRDASGALYGTTGGGGPDNVGTVFRLTPPEPGVSAWTETILHSFSKSDGSDPFRSGLIMDGSGALYGTTLSGGADYLKHPEGGVVFKLVPPASGQGQWTEQVLHNFGEVATDGAGPIGTLAMDAKGNLFGTTQNGGATPGYGGTVYELSPPAAGQSVWTETILFSFDKAPRGELPQAGVVLGPDGSLYGTTLHGGTSRNCLQGCGAVFRLSPPAHPGQIGHYSLLHSFALAPDGALPVAPVALDEAGNLYGTTQYGGVVTSNCKQGCGTIFKLSPPAGGEGDWIETVLAPPDRREGKQPQAGLLIGSDGRLYGTTSDGGPRGNGEGTVFRVIPVR